MKDSPELTLLHARTTTEKVHYVVRRRHRTDYMYYATLCNRNVNIGIHGQMYGWSKTSARVTCEHCKRMVKCLDV